MSKKADIQFYIGLVLGILGAAIFFISRFLKILAILTLPSWVIITGGCIFFVGLGLALGATIPRQKKK